MTYTFVNRPSVGQDIIDAVDQNKKINPEIAKQFLFRIKEAKAYIAQYPQGFPIKYQQVRTLLLKQFPYHIHYLMDESQKKLSF